MIQKEITNNSNPGFATTAINNITVNDDFWFMINEHLIAFRLQGMQEDIHFSIAYNSNAAEFNLHITRSIKGTTNKPKIEIIRISKKELEELESYFLRALFNLILQPIHLKTSGRRNGRSHYGISFFSLDESNKNEIICSMEKMLIVEFKGIAHIHKNRLKIKGDIDHSVKKIVHNKSFANSLKNNLRWLPCKINVPVTAGIIISKKFTGHAICIHNKWFTIRHDLKPIDLLHAWMEPTLAKHLVFKTLMAYARIKRLSNYAESGKYDQSIYLRKSN